MHDQKTGSVKELHRQKFDLFGLDFDQFTAILVLKKTNEQCQSSEIQQEALDVHKLHRFFLPFVDLQVTLPTLDLEVPFANLGSLGSFCQPWTFMYLLQTFDLQVPGANLGPLRPLSNFCQGLVVYLFKQLDTM